MSSLTPGHDVRMNPHDHCAIRVSKQCILQHLQKIGFVRVTCGDCSVPKGLVNDQHVARW
ncbi:hypothetical protein JL37_29210 [Achromobacter sp. RTa]|nr:hypothetical protein JL37_29210 [Achromobacter sp. RTa]